MCMIALKTPGNQQHDDVKKFDVKELPNIRKHIPAFISDDLVNFTVNKVINYNANKQAQKDVQASQPQKPNILMNAMNTVKDKIWNTKNGYIFLSQTEEDSSIEIKYANSQTLPKHLDPTISSATVVALQGDNFLISGKTYAKINIGDLPNPGETRINASNSVAPKDFFSSTQVKSLIAASNIKISTKPVDIKGWTGWKINRNESGEILVKMGEKEMAGDTPTAPPAVEQHNVPEKAAKQANTNNTGPAPANVPPEPAKAAEQAPAKATAGGRRRVPVLAVTMRTKPLTKIGRRVTPDGVERTVYRQGNLHVVRARVHGRFRIVPVKDLPR